MRDNWHPTSSCTAGEGNCWSLLYCRQRGWVDFKGVRVGASACPASSLTLEGRMQVEPPFYTEIQEGFSWKLKEGDQIITKKKLPCTWKMELAPGDFDLLAKWIGSGKKTDWCDHVDVTPPSGHSDTTVEEGLRVCIFSHPTLLWTSEGRERVASD